MFYSSTKSALRMAFTAASLFIAAPAFAHVDGSHGLGMAAGLAHPFFGLDHLLAMLAVGIWAAQCKRPASYLLLFPLIMALGAAISMASGGLPLVGALIEPAIAASVAVLGILIACKVKAPAPVGAMLIALFALAHGYAHGAELPVGASPLGYGAGFIIATLSLHLAGLAIGGFAIRRAPANTMRVAGTGIAAVGAYLLAAAG